VAALPCALVGEAAAQAAAQAAVEAYADLRPIMEELRAEGAPLQGSVTRTLTRRKLRLCTRGAGDTKRRTHNSRPNQETRSDTSRPNPLARRRL